MGKVRENWIDICRGIAIIAVVWGHIGTSYHSANLLLDSNVINYSITLVYSFHMPLFFVLSGYLASLKDISNNNAKNEIQKKAINYGIPFLIFTVISWTIKHIITILNSDMINRLPSFNSLLMMFVYPIGAMWFIYALMIISIFHILLYPKLNKAPAWTILIFLLLLKILASYVEHMYEMESIELSDMIVFRIFKYYFWYELGFYSAKNIKKLYITKTKINPLLIYIGIVAYLIIVYFKYIYGFPELVDIIISAIGILLVISISLTINESRIIEKIGRLTLPIYFLHGYFVSASRIMLIKLKLPLLFGITPIVIGIIAGVALPMIMYLIISKCPIIDFCFYPSKHIKITSKS